MVSPQNVAILILSKERANKAELCLTTLKQFPSRGFHFFSALAQLVTSAQLQLRGNPCRKVAICSAWAKSYFCSIPLRKFPRRVVLYFSVPLHQGVFRQRLCSAPSERRSSFIILSKDLFGNEESRRVAVSVIVEKDSYQLDRHRAYVGLLK